MDIKALFAPARVVCAGLLVSSSVACGAEADPGGEGEGPLTSCDRFASEAIDVSFGPGQDVGRDRFPEVAFGPPEGKGDREGSTTGVVSLGNGGTVTLGFGDSVIVDGAGPDFIVFENPFFSQGDEDNVFAELGTVEVSEDEENWVEFPCTASEPPYGSCAGWHPVYAHHEENELDPLDPEQAGGDPFDLADVGLERARFVRITDREDQVGLAGVFDLDAVAIVHVECPP